ncbi:hypothetical protein N8J89_30705 [Crossiella sp. CA-258035]|uniref:hypothetical protein n=1 Tax=Crossiella sp. CA-258035 TaxID=2981138 RepID=UPI0024BCC6CA|nr:hypothetical protein [Crossiella sp. CA-258035]WHT17471.1 hypothetical protein N8J89_30705 [Crossiella sp. CA-258035]
MYLATLCFLDRPVDEDFRGFHRAELAPMLTATGGPALASFSTEYAANNFPRLPVREGEHAFLWLSRFASAEELAAHQAERAGTTAWRALTERLIAEPTALPLLPTAGSALQ